MLAPCRGVHAAVGVRIVAAKADPHALRTGGVLEEDVFNHSLLLPQRADAVALPVVPELEGVLVVHEKAHAVRLFGGAVDVEKSDRLGPGVMVLKLLSV